MRVFQMVMAVLFCAALTFYLWVAVPRVQAQDTSMPVLTDETDGELALSVTAPESAYCAGLHAEDAHDGDLTDEICIAGMSALLDGDRRRLKYVVFDADCHAATLTRTVRYTDYDPPRFALNVPSTYRNGRDARAFGADHSGGRNGRRRFRPYSTVHRRYYFCGKRHVHAAGIRDEFLRRTERDAALYAAERQQS